MNIAMIDNHRPKTRWGIRKCCAPVRPMRTYAAAVLLVMLAAALLPAHADAGVWEHPEIVVDNAVSVMFDVTPPVIELLGDNPLTVPLGETFADPGAQAIDNLAGDVSDRIEVDGSVDTSIPGQYTLIYFASDPAGNEAEPVSRTVLVEEENQTPPTGTVEVRVNLDEAEWTLTGGDGATYQGVGDATVENVAAGGVTIRFQPVENYDTPPDENALLESGQTVTFEGQYIESTHHVIWSRRDHNGSPGRRVVTPVHLNGGGGNKAKSGGDEELTQFAVEIGFDDSLLTLKDVTGGDYVEKWDPIHVNAKSNSVSITGNGGGGSLDGGILAVLHFEVCEEVEKSTGTSIHFTHASLNNGSIPVSTRDGRINIRTNMFVWGDVDGDDEVTVTDADYLLRYKAGLIDELPITAKSPEPDYLGGANVSGAQPPAAGALDAALVLQYVQGIIDRFPADHDGDGFGPESDAPSNDFAENLLGYLDQATTRTMYVPSEIPISPGIHVEAPVRLNNAARVLGYFFDIAYDAELLELVDVEKGTSADENWVQPIVNSEGGRVRAAAAGVKSSSGAGSLAVLRFRVHDDAADGDVARLEVLDADLNDGVIPIEITSAPSAPEPKAVIPAKGSAAGGAVVRIQGSNLHAVDGVYFGDAAAEWFEVDTLRSEIRALTPAGSGAVDIRLTAFDAEGSLEEGFTYFTPDVQLAIVPPEEVDLGGSLKTPVEITTAGGSQIRQIQFDLNYDPRIFTAIETDAIPALVEAEQGVLVDAELRRPGVLRVTVESPDSSGLGAGVVAHCYLLAIGYDDEYPSLIYLSDVRARSAAGASIPAGLGVRR